MSAKALERLQARFPNEIVSTHAQQGDETAVVKRDHLVDVLTFLRDEPELKFDMPVDLTVVDWFRQREPRFDVVYHLLSTKTRQRVRLKVQVDEDDARVPSSFSVWPGFDWYEREAYDLYGVVFEGHPNLKRILMYEGFEGHPLRKDYPINKRQPIAPLIGEGAE